MTTMSTDARSQVLLVFAPNSWDGPWMNRQQLLSRLGRHYTIIYSTGLPQLGRRKSPDGGGVGGRVRPRDNVHLDSPPAWLFRPTRFPWLRRFADELAVRRWRRIARTLGGGQITAYVFHPKFWPQVARLRPARVVYHAYDLYHLQGKQQHSFDSEEAALVRRADLVVASSLPIAEHLRSIGARRVELVENAADFDIFSAVDPGEGSGGDPADLIDIPRPRVGYTGALNRKVDFPLFVRLAERFPGVHFVFVGQPGRLNPAGASAMERLQALTNVHFVGFKVPAELPAYMAAMDVNVMAYRVGDDVWTAGIYPLKLHEYLAVGQPVVSSDLPAVRPFADVIRIATSPEDWERGISEALDGRGVGSTATRRERARQNSWTARAEQLHALVRAIVTGERAPDGPRDRVAGG